MSFEQSQPSGEPSRRAKAKALRELMEREGAAVGQNTRTVNQLSAFAVERFEPYEQLRSEARQIKEDAIDSLPALIETLSESVANNGGTVHLASSAADANELIADILSRHDAETLVKSKSMTTEELDVNEHLEADGYEVVETDLGEYVIQLAEESPSHLIGPAIHKSAEDIAALFNDTFDLEGEGTLTADPNELTAFARDRVGEAIRRADVGMTGANFVVAETGTIALVTNEGNARKTAVSPPVHIAVAGVEKLVPHVDQLQPFTELIARSGTGQDITSYFSLLTPPVDSPIPDFEADSFHPAEEREFHLVLLDNGRMAMREDEDLRETLYCIRCGACSNSCSNFQAVGGHAFGGQTYTGGIGTGWEAGVHGQEQAASMNDLCTGCSRCVPRCPVKIDIPWINTVVRDRINRGRDPSTFDHLVDGLMADAESPGLDAQKRLFGNIERIAKLGQIAPAVSNALAGSRPGRWALDRWFGVDSRAGLPTLADETLFEWDKRREVTRAQSMGAESNREVVLFPDLYTTYFDPSRGKAAVSVLEAIGVDVRIPQAPESGRAPLSQGMIETAREQASAVHAALQPHIEAGRDIVVVEPSALAMFREDYEKLLSAESFEQISSNTYDVMEYIYGCLDNGVAVDALSTGDGVSVAFHPHCQGRTLGTDSYTEAVLAAAGYTVRTSDVECCGMAGSFGYKTEYYDVAEAAGDHLKDDLGDVTGERVVATGTSCGSQLSRLYDRRAAHPIELIAPES